MQLGSARFTAFSLQNTQDCPSSLCLLQKISLVTSFASWALCYNFGISSSHFPSGNDVPATTRGPPVDMNNGTIASCSPSLYLA